jgi:hypothetical protein
MRSLPLLALLILPVLAQSAAPTAPAASLQNLVANSPFGPVANGPTGGPPTATPLEFRGTFVDGGERFFSVLDTGSRRAEWVALNETGRPFVVKAYDADKESIAVEFQGRVLDLKLRDARVVAAPLQAAPAAAPNAAPTPPGQPMPGAPTLSVSTTEAQRLAQVAEEIRRRRALRQQATSQPPPNTAPPPNPPRK